MNQELKDDLIRDEGLRLACYKDSLGYWTIGVGHLLGLHARMTVITNEEAMALLEMDVHIAEERVRTLFPSWFTSYQKDDPVRYRALTNMAFNLGGKLEQFKKFIAAVESRNWIQAGTEMLQSVWAKQVGQRAIRLHAMITTGKDLV